ncbi:hypothetical protein [Brachybacterium epidermidis]|uniref:hypothetical protein n=1 Tax=Brachybacterium epidermidis TaxID=2781983 RepID=UPI0032B8728E
MRSPPAGFREPAGPGVVGVTGFGADELACPGPGGPFDVQRLLEDHHGCHLVHDLAVLPAATS